MLLAFFASRWQGSGMDSTLADFLDDTPATAGAIADVALIERLLQEAAQAGQSLSYSELLMQLASLWSLT